jgi:hypothetical protein
VDDIQSLTSLENNSMLLPKCVCSVKNPVICWPERHDTTASDIAERGRRPDDHQASCDRVQRQIINRLSADYQKSSQLYIYKVE